MFFWVLSYKHEYDSFRKARQYPKTPFLPFSSCRNPFLWLCNRGSMQSSFAGGRIPSGSGPCIIFCFLTFLPQKAPNAVLFLGKPSGGSDSSQSSGAYPFTCVFRHICFGLVFVLTSFHVSNLRVRLSLSVSPRPRTPDKCLRLIPNCTAIFEDQRSSRSEALNDH